MRVHFQKPLIHGILTGLLLAPALWPQDAKKLDGDWTMTVDDKKGGKYIFTIFTFHVDGDRLTGFMQSPNGTRRVPLEGEIHGVQFSFTFDKNTVTGKMLSDTSMDVTFPGREGPRTFTVPKTPGASKSLPELPKAVNGVDQSTMGPYRTLANLAYEAYQKGEMDKAGMFCQLLGRVWDQGETDLNRKNGGVWLPIDKAMDDFNGAIKSSKKKAADPAKVEALYRTYLDKLKAADK